MCILSEYTLLKVVGYYDLSILSMSVMGFQKIVLDGVSSIQFFFGFLEFLELCKDPKYHTEPSRVHLLMYSKTPIASCTYPTEQEFL